MKKEITPRFPVPSFPPLGLNNFLSIEGMTAQQIETLLDRAQQFCDLAHCPDKNTRFFEGRTQINLFFENSTRTRTSFEIAGQRLGMNAVNLDIAHSSVKKGETLLDTALTLSAMRPAIAVMRHSASGAAEFLSGHLSCPLVNAGDGAHAHPTQALLDALTIRQAKGRIKGLTIAICGDIVHSRVARSNLFSLGLLGARLRFVGPSALLPPFIADSGIEFFHSMNEGIKDADVIMMLRLQNERMDGAFFPSAREYYHFYGLDEQRLKQVKPDCIILHPGPMNRGVEIASSVADGPQGLIRKQVENGVAARMAVMEELLRSAESESRFGSEIPSKQRKAA